MNDLWAPSSKKMFPSKLISDELIVVMAILSKHALAYVVSWLTLDFLVTGVISITVLLNSIL